MENTINYNLTHVIDYTPYQLRLPIDLSLVIDKLDPMWSFLEIVNSINLRRFIRSHKGNQGYDPIMMMRVITMRHCAIIICVVIWLSPRKQFQYCPQYIKHPQTNDPRNLYREYAFQYHCYFSYASPSGDKALRETRDEITLNELNA